MKPQLKTFFMLEFHAFVFSTQIVENLINLDDHQLFELSLM